MADIFREIDEELRRDNLAKLWARYGNSVIAAAVVVVLVTAGIVGWRQYEARQRQDEGARYAAALDLARQGKTAAAADAFAAIGRDAHASQAMLARFEQASLDIRQGDPAASIALYDAIAKDGSLEPVYRDLATLLAIRYEFDKQDPKAVIDRLKPLTDAASPWHPTALELTALAELKAGDKNAARQSYQKLADDLAAPPGIRARATEMIAALGQ
ncbi:MAG TPA: tetratricopeptide repeat protein [Stellaceae bacterium]|nr:tetratricopeptide repeat protein [Stellaceae bacterium]